MSSGGGRFAAAREVREPSEPDDLGPTLGWLTDQSLVQIWDGRQARLIREIQPEDGEISDQSTPRELIVDVLFPSSPVAVGIQTHDHHYAFALQLGTGAFTGWGLPHGRFVSSRTGNRFGSILAGAGNYCNIILYGAAFERSGDVMAGTEDPNACSAQPLNFSNDETRLATSATDLFWTESGEIDRSRDVRTVQVIDLASDRVLISRPGQTGAVSPDGRRLAVWNAAEGQAGQGTIYDVSTGRVLATLSGHLSEAATIAWSPDGRTVATGGMDSLVFLWDASTGRERLMFGGFPGPVCGLAFSDDGDALTTRCRQMIRTYDVGSGRLLAGFEMDRDGVEDLAYAPDGSTVAVGRRDSAGGFAVELWRVEGI